MHQDRIIQGKRYQVVVEPVGPASLTGMTLAVYVDNNPIPIYKKSAHLGDAEETLFQEGWSIAESDAAVPKR
jgi:hypothetical protein